MQRLTFLVLMAALTAPAAAQDLPTGQFPDGFRVRTDRADQSADSVVFVTMEPGWHITTGPAVILYDPSHTASGSYRVESETFLFDPGRLNEAYGFFIGGRALDGPDQAYTYFLVRRTGEYLVKRRQGTATPEVRDWTAHPAIARWDDRPAEAATVKNVLAVDVGADSVRFFVNGQEVTSLPSAGLDTDGVVGLRVNHGVNLHVTTLDITQR